MDASEVNFISLIGLLNCAFIKKNGSAKWSNIKMNLMDSSELFLKWLGEDWSKKELISS